MEALINPILFYLCLVIGGLGVSLALPRRHVSPQVLGAMLAATAFGAIFLLLGLSTYQGNPADLPGIYFYVFALIAIGASLRVISHPRPVYSALYFILTILSSSVLYLMLGAEFMAFSLIIIYAGAILITYLFVIMLATQAPQESDVGALSEYDAFSREPMIATCLGFVLLAVLSGLIATGLTGGRHHLPLQPAAEARLDLTNEMPRKVIRELDGRGFFSKVSYDSGSGVPFTRPEIADVEVTDGVLYLDVDDPAAARHVMLDEGGRITEIIGAGAPGANTVSGDDRIPVRIPASAMPSNIDGVGYALVAEHPMALELAGVILLMALLGAVVLARKQIELTEDEKAARARTLGASMSGGSS